MCRLFGFRSIIESHVHSSLTSAENALGVQAASHPDGWGVAYYVAGTPHVIKSSSAACEDRLFKRVSGVVTSDTVIAHVRRATVGELSILNSHPFQFGRWTFAHNGDIPDFQAVRAELVDTIAPKLRRYVLGDTDSEVLFFMILSNIARREDLHRPGVPVEVVADAMRESLATVEATSARHGLADPLLTTIITDGSLLLASRVRKELHLSTRKNRCPERDSCPSFRTECEVDSPFGFVSHFIVSSEPLQGDNVWNALADRSIVGCDQRLRRREWAL